jgi:DNA-binding NarL/FixJ family response regulator
MKISLQLFKKVLNGEKYLSLKLSELLIESYIRSNNYNNPFEILSQREMEVAEQLDSGKTLAQICDILKIQ